MFFALKNKYFNFQYGRVFAFLICYIFVGSTPLLAQKNTFHSGNQQWVQYYNQLKFNQKWSLLTDGGFRWKNSFSNYSQYQIRTGAGYAINPNINIAAGIAHSGAYLSEQVVRVEFRIYQDTLLKHASSRVRFNHRFRIEERFFNPYNGKIQTPNSYNFRFRYGFTTSIPLFNISNEKLGKAVLLNLGNEIFINAGKQTVNQVFDQNRFLISPTYRYSDNLDISFTWNTLISSTRVATDYLYLNVFWLQVKHKIDLSSKK